MKSALLGLLILASFSAQAIVDEKIVEECRDIALVKLSNKAENLGADLDIESIEKLDEEKKVLAPSVYLWFKADAYRKEDKSRIFVTALMEKPVLPLKKPCF